MDAFVSPLHELGSFEELERASAEEGTVLSATGCMDAQKPHMMYGWNNGRVIMKLLIWQIFVLKLKMENYIWIRRLSSN